MKNRAPKAQNLPAHMRRRNLAVLAILVGLVVLIFAVTIVRMNGA